MQTLVENRRQAIKVRAVLWGAVAVAFAAVWWGSDIYQTFGLNPGDGGVLRPLWERAAFGGFIALLGIGTLVGMAVYASIYVLEIRRDGDRIEIDTMNILGRHTHRFDRNALKSGKHYHGRLVTGLAPSVNAPWRTLSVAGRRLPFIVDMQSEKNALGKL